jgi:hypothetical protein
MKSLSDKPLLVLSKQNNDYSALFEKRVGGMKGSKTNSFLTNYKLNRQNK